MVKIMTREGFVERLVSISVSLFVDWLSLSNTESEVNPNNNLMMRRAGLSGCSSRKYISGCHLLINRWSIISKKAPDLRPRSSYNLTMA